MQQINQSTQKIAVYALSNLILFFVVCIANTNQFVRYINIGIMAMHKIGILCIKQKQINAEKIYMKKMRK